MKYLGIESTAHTFAIGIIDDKRKILADQRSMYTSEKGGIVPSEAANLHRKVKEKILQEALEEANLKIEDIDVISFSQGPGLPPSLLVGKDFAKHIAIKYNKANIVFVRYNWFHKFIMFYKTTPFSYKILGTFFILFQPLLCFSSFYKNLSIWISFSTISKSTTPTCHMID